MKVLGLIALIALASIVDCQRCPNPPSDWSVFCDEPNIDSPPIGYIFSIVFEMPVTFFMDRSIQHCIMVGNGVMSSPLGTNAVNRLCLNRYDSVRLRQRSESIQLQFFERNRNISGQMLVDGFSSMLTRGVRFTYPLLPYDPAFEQRFRTNYTETFYFPVTYFGPGATVGEEIFDPRGDLVRVGFSPFDAGDYIYSILGTAAFIIVFSLFVYGFFIQPYYL